MTPLDFIHCCVQYFLMSYYEEENDYQQEEENDDYGMGSCPKCGSKRYTDVDRGENCDDCGYYVYYP